MLAPVRFDVKPFCLRLSLMFSTDQGRGGLRRPRWFNTRLFTLAVLLAFCGAVTSAYASPVVLPGVTAIGDTSTAHTVSVVVTANGQLGKVSALRGGVANLDFAL
jgi:large repetitive protein